MLYSIMNVKFVGLIRLGSCLFMHQNKGGIENLVFGLEPASIMYQYYPRIG